jgi:pyruvate ferredoxin oxidoreductase beta subunit
MTQTAPKQAKPVNPAKPAGKPKTLKEGYIPPKERLFAPGHRGCAGCAELLAARLVVEAAGPNTIIANNTGCLEVTTTPYPESSWGVPWIHSLFENAAAVASGIEAALKATGKKEGINIIAQGGDGSTVDIGLGLISGMMERGHDILYVCYDNEAYMNTGVQRSGATPYCASTTTSPSGEFSFGNMRPKKPMPEIMAAHGIPYSATASAAYPRDLQKKVKKALSIKGPKYLHVHVPCPTGWYADSVDTIKIGRLAVETGLFPLYEIENGVVTNVMKPKTRPPVEEYLKTQNRFKHLFAKEGGAEVIKQIQALADKNAQRLGLDEK